MVAAIERGFPQREIADAAFRYQAEVERRKRIVVGVNDYVTEDAETELHRPDPEAERRQKERLEATTAARDDARVETTLAELKRAAAGEGNLMPLIIECARARVSEGEMVAAMQEVFGTYTEHPQF